MSDKNINFIVAADGKSPRVYQGTTPRMRMKKSQQVTKTEIPQEITQGTFWAFWGKNDRLPQTILHKIGKVPIAKSALKKKREMIYGRGLAYFLESDIRDGNTEVKRAYIPEVEEWLQKNRVATQQLPQDINEYLLLNNSFTEFILSNDRSKITSMNQLTAPFCRFSKQNKTTLNIDYVLYHAKFFREYGSYPTLEEMKVVPLINLFDVERFFKSLRGYKFVWHSSFPSPGKTYYSEVEWEGLTCDDGWLDAAANVPKIINAMQNNQIVLKYQINIPMSYFINRFGSEGWMSMDKGEQEKEIEALRKRIEDHLSGSDNYFKSLTLFFNEDEMSGKAIGKVEIIALDDKTKADTWVPSSEAADAQIAIGMGVHPSQIGLSSNNRNQGSGGSDQRESFNTAVLLQSLEQEIILEKYNFVSKFNKWGVRFVLLHENHTTTNNQESGVISNPDAVTVTE